MTGNTHKRKRTSSKSKPVYSTGAMNIVIDALVHPWVEQHWIFIIVDEALHAANEQDPKTSLLKFLKYNAPELLKRVVEDLKERDRT